MVPGLIVRGKAGVAAALHHGRGPVADWFPVRGVATPDGRGVLDVETGMIPTFPCMSPAGEPGR
ncbi:hypothetical protein Ssi03_72350 [Sphaerisporangium siamense]|nr:hypothetical protein Ssi03_72350 [Sphaerisporangium siamense]